MTKQARKILSAALFILLSASIFAAPVNAQTDWVTFRSQQFKFRFHYPPDWRIGSPLGPDVRGKVVSPTGKPTANCVVVVRELPESATYSQKDLNKNIEIEIWEDDEWFDALSANPSDTKIFDKKIIRINKRPAQYAVSVTPFQIKDTRIFMKSMNFIAMSPGYVWRFGCGAAGKTEGEAAFAYEFWKPAFERIFSSFVFDQR